MSSRAKHWSVTFSTNFTLFCQLYSLLGCSTDRFSIQPECLHISHSREYQGTSVWYWVVPKFWYRTQRVGQFGCVQLCRNVWHTQSIACPTSDARRHVNRMCMAARVPLVESGTAGYLGQVQPILKVSGLPAFMSRCFFLQRVEKET